MQCNIDVQNTDNIPATYSLSIKDCDDGTIIAPTDTTFSLESNLYHLVEFKVTAVVTTKDSKQFNCKAVLLDSTGTEIDSRVFAFTATKEKAVIDSVATDVTGVGGVHEKSASGEACKSFSIW